VPVIVISTEGNDDDKTRALQAGASAYLAKPIQAPAVVGAVTQLFKQHK
jgi:two-component system chemotaxis response regulator CheY